MTISISPTKSDVTTALRAFLLAVLPANVEVILGQANRVPEPKVVDFVVMTPIRRERLATNENGSDDALFTASISGTAMTVTDVAFGTLGPGSPVFGVGVADGTEIVSGGPGVGSYVVSKSQSVSSGPMAAGETNATQETRFVVQLDLHGPNGGDNAQIVSTLFRDDFGVRFFAALPVTGGIVVPLLADDPKQIPFQNAEQQYEDRWVVEAALQANETVTVPQQYAGALAITLVDVDATYPP